MIRKITMGESPETDCALYALVGHWVLDIEVHKKIGNAVSSAAGDVWLIRLAEHEERALGFLVLREAKNGHAHIRYAYAEEGAIRRELLNDASRLGKETGVAVMWTNERESDPDLPAVGFAKDGKRRGVWYKWEKTLT